MRFINLDIIFTWRDNNELISKLQDYGVIHKDNEIKCPNNHCDGYFKTHLDQYKSDGAQWGCSGTVRWPKKKAVKCLKR